MKLKPLYVEKPEIAANKPGAKHGPVWLKRWRVWTQSGTYLGDIILLPDKKTYRVTVSLKLDIDMYVKEPNGKMRYNPHHKTELMETTDRSQVLPLFKATILNFISHLIE